MFASLLGILFITLLLFIAVGIVGHLLFGQRQ